MFFKKKCWQNVSTDIDFWSSGFQLISSNEYKRLKDIWQSIFLPEAFLIIIRILSHLILVFHTTEGDWKGCSSKNKQSRFNFYKIFRVCVCMEMFVCLFVLSPPSRRTGHPLLRERMSRGKSLKTWLTAWDRGSSKLLLASLNRIFLPFCRRPNCSAESKPTAR